jgi:hypothetical protein
MFKAGNRINSGLGKYILAIPDSKFITNIQLQATSLFGVNYMKCAIRARAAHPKPLPNGQ